MWSAAASIARRRFGFVTYKFRATQSAVAAALCRRTPNSLPQVQGLELFSLLWIVRLPYKEKSQMKRTFIGICLALLVSATGTFTSAQTSEQAHWPQWRGPFFNGMARGDAPTVWSDASNIKWKAEIPGRGYSTPVIWGNRIFITTAIPTGKPAPTPAPKDPAPAASPAGSQPSPADAQQRGRRPGGDAGPQAEHKFEVLCLDRKTGKLLWQRTGKVAVPHEGYHRAYGSFASNSPVTDGKYVYASFGSRGIYCYDFNGKLIWAQDLDVQMKMRLAFGEGTAPLLLGDRLILI